MFLARWVIPICAYCLRPKVLSEGISAWWYFFEIVDLLLEILNLLKEDGTILWVFLFTFIWVVPLIYLHWAKSIEKFFWRKVLHHFYLPRSWFPVLRFFHLLYFVGYLFLSFLGVFWNEGDFFLNVFQTNNHSFFVLLLLILESFWLCLIGELGLFNLFYLNFALPFTRLTQIASVC